jgi:hypothetical protein
VDHASLRASGQEIFAGAGLLLGTPVLTLDGELPVEYIAPGDRVVTRNGLRRVTSVEVTRVENARVVCLACDSLGIGRPQQETVVAPAQAILIRDWRAAALYGKAEALIAAQRLCDGEFIRADILPEARFVTLRFARPEVIYAGGMEMACSPVTVAA